MIEDIKIPLISVKDVVIFPHSTVPIALKRDKSVRALEEALLRDKKLFLVMQKKREVEFPTPEDMYKIGSIALITQVQRLPDGLINITVEGIQKAKSIALEEMEQEAVDKGANAVISVDLDYETVGQNGSMLMVSASGTAVILE